MAIQMRRGAYGDLDPTKAVNAEVLVVTSNDPIATDGKAVYIAFAPGDVKRMATHDELGTYETNAQMSAAAAQESASSASTSAQTASGSATAAKSWAVGPNGSGPGTSTNNSKYYAEQAASEATLAKSWAVGPSGSGSGTDTNNSKYYAEQAAASQAAVEGLLDTVLGNFATVESSTTASKAYKIGEYLVLNNLLYRVTAAIASGGTITVGTNVVQTTVGDEVANNVLCCSDKNNDGNIVITLGDGS